MLSVLFQVCWITKTFALLALTSLAKVTLALTVTLQPPTLKYAVELLHEPLSFTPPVLICGGAPGLTVGFDDGWLLIINSPEFVLSSYV